MACCMLLLLHILQWTGDHFLWWALVKASVFLWYCKLLLFLFGFASFMIANEVKNLDSRSSITSAQLASTCFFCWNLDLVIFFIWKNQQTLRDGWRYQNGWIFGKVPKGWGVSFSMQKIILQILGTLNRAFEHKIYTKE